jgi:hypothetical protein
MPLDYIVDNDPWLVSATNNLSLDTWMPNKTKVPRSPIFESVGNNAADAWKTIPDRDLTPIKVKSPAVAHSVPNVPKEFFSTSSKIDAWTVQAAPIENKKKTQLKQSQQQQQAPMQQQQAQVQQVALTPEEQALEDAEVKAIEDELAIQNRYKTELCKSYTDTGICRYGTKCQFAHGKEEIRPILRHPKYKTEICKTFHSTGTCPYGIRCRFIHTRAKDEYTVFGDEDANKTPPPPGIPVPQWSKSWTPQVVMPQKKASSKKHGLGKVPLVESVPDY